MQHDWENWFLGQFADVAYCARGFINSVNVLARCSAKRKVVRLSLLASQFP